jgi:hypothetical protein
LHLWDKQSAFVPEVMLKQYVLVPEAMSKGLARKLEARESG